eukprot:GHVP01062161.1.p2 GENE.GHVP01062161.1~~GHVP01062161.1.p2  ORF type:complete len:115 (+),score=9.97 GHVP01062161.1:68-412(+)
MCHFRSVSKSSREIKAIDRSSGEASCSKTAATFPESSVSKIKRSLGLGNARQTSLSIQRSSKAAVAAGVKANRLGEFHILKRSCKGLARFAKKGINCRKYPAIPKLLQNASKLP